MTEETFVSGFRALGTGAVVATTTEAALDRALATVAEELDAIDRACSRFRLDSDLSRVNASPGQWVEVSPLMIEALDVALRAARLTGGLVDPTVGRALVAAGYAGDFASVPREGPPLRLSLSPVPGWQQVNVNRTSRRVRVAQGVGLDFGATAKALAADRAAEAAAKAAGCGVLVGCGGDIAVAGEPPNDGWLVAVAEHHEGAPADAWIRVGSGGLATSGVTARAWRRGETVLHHIIDPARGLPAETPWGWVSVAAATCVDANIAATAAILLGAAAPDWLAAQGLAARLVDGDGGVTAIGGWPLDSAA